MYVDWNGNEQEDAELSGFTAEDVRAARQAAEDRASGLLTAIVRLQSMDINVMRTLIGEDTTLTRRKLTTQELKNRARDMQRLTTVLTDMRHDPLYVQDEIYRSTIARIWGKTGRGIEYDYSAHFVAKYLAPLF